MYQCVRCWSFSACVLVTDWNIKEVIVVPDQAKTTKDEEQLLSLQWRRSIDFLDTKKTVANCCGGGSLKEDTSLLRRTEERNRILGKRIAL